jgi:Fic family protein
MLFGVPALDADDQRVLGEIEEFYATFARATGGAQVKRWVGGVRKRFVAGAIRGSNSIEGYTVDRPTATAIVDGAAVPASVPEESVEAVTGYRDALTWVLHSPEMDFFRYDEVLLSVLHFMMLRHWAGKSPGRYRTRGIIVTGDDPLAPAYVGPPAEEVPDLMRELVEWLNAGDLDAHVLVRGAMAHLMAVAIHPWRDGNGRMSRCLQTLVIARSGRTHPEFCSIEEWLGFEPHTQAYYQALSETQRGSYRPANDTHGWVRFCLRAHHQQAQLVDRRLRLGAAVWAGVEAMVERLGLGERTVSALYAAASDQLRREVYQRDESISRDQSIRDIRRLEQLGLIEAVGYGQTLYYVATGELKELADAEAAPLTAPYSEPYPQPGRG